MTRALPATLQTVYAELLERCSIDRMAQQFPLGGNFYRRELKGRGYWYYKASIRDDPRRRDRYVGPDSPEIRETIDGHATAKADMKERRTLVVALQRAGLGRPDRLTGDVLAALADAGAFRLRAVVVGSVAYQIYGGLLGYVFDARNMATQDLDIAQFPAVSVEVGDSIGGSLLDVLRRVDPEFREIPGLDVGWPNRYVLGNGRFRVEVLAPNRGPDDDRPVQLPSIGTGGQPIRYLDFLIRHEVRALVLHGNGVLVNVPAPERYAIHKLLISRLRIASSDSQAKAAKDLRQAGELLRILIVQRPFEVREIWEEAVGRGPKWRAGLTEAVTLLDQATGSTAVREELEALVGSP